MEKIIIYRKKSTEISPIQIEINGKSFHIGWGEKKDIEIDDTNRKFTIRAKGLFGFEGSKEIELNKNKITSIVLVNRFPNEFAIIAISSLLLLFVLSVCIEIIPIYFFHIYTFLITLFLFAYSLIKRKDYYRFEEL